MANLELEFERAVRLLTEHVPLSDESSRKPALFHALRVGVDLYKRGYSHVIVLAGLLHDALEWSSLAEPMLRGEFGDDVANVVHACTKDDSIKDPTEKINELIKRCVAAGEDALIVKTADVLDSFAYYTRACNQGELIYCERNAEAIFAQKPERFGDDIFRELESWHKATRSNS